MRKMKRRATMAIFLLGLGVLLAGTSLACGSESQGSAGDDGGSQARPFPDFVYTSNESFLAYARATENGALFKQMPCFCGCGNLPDAPHQSLYDCFINDDGTYDSHAAYCTLCSDIAADAVRWQQEGTSTADIRAMVESKYSGSGPATDTPPVVE